MQPTIVALVWQFYQTLSLTMTSLVPMQVFSLAFFCNNNFGGRKERIS